MADGEWSDDRRRIAYEEARAVVNAQNETMSDIDEKAMRSVRLTAVLIGLLIAALQVEPAAFHETVLSVALGSLVLSAVAGIATYDESQLFVGTDGDFIDKLANGTELNHGWDRELAETFAGMLAENYTDIQRNAKYLRATNALLIAGIVLAAAAVLI